MREDWSNCEAYFLGELIRGVNYKKPQSSNSERPGYLPILRANNIKNGTLNFDNLIFVQQELLKSEQKILNGDIVFAMSSGSKHLVGKSGQAKSNYSGSFGAFCSVFRPNNFIDPNFIQFYFQSTAFRSIVSNASKGSNINNLKREHILNSIIPLPPPPEQRAIVAKIEELFSELDKGEEDLKKAQEQLKIYRQAVLKKAFEGELTGSQEFLEHKLLGNAIKVVSGTTPKGLKEISNKGGHPFYKVSDMNLPGNEVEMKSSNIRLTKDEIDELKIKVYPKGTIIFPKRGGAILTNKKRILSEEASFDLNLMGIVPNNKFSSMYLYYFFVSLDLGKICDGSAVPQINNKHIAPLDFPVYPVEIQKEIIQEIESRLSVCDSIEASIRESLNKSKALRQSILKKAFEGTLLSEEEIAACKAASDYEPASVLLERIKAEKKKK